VAHITGLPQIGKCSDVLNILAFLKTSAEERVSTSNVIEFCVTLLEEAAHDADDSLARKLSFISEQLSLATKGVYQRRYSSLLLANAVLWDNTSPALYRQLVAEDILCLPSKG
jgi:hypothetical protein